MTVAIVDVAVYVVVVVVEVAQYTTNLNSISCSSKISRLTRLIWEGVRNLFY